MRALHPAQQLVVSASSSLVNTRVDRELNRTAESLSVSLAQTTCPSMVVTRALAVLPLATNPPNKYYLSYYLQSTSSLYRRTFELITFLKIHNKFNLMLCKASFLERLNKFYLT